LYQTLARRSNESYEVWYDRINYPLFYCMPGEIGRPWIESLSTEDKEAMNAIHRRIRNEDSQQVDRWIRELIESDRQQELEQRRLYDECLRSGSRDCY